MSFIIILNILSSLWGQFDEIRKVNHLKAEGEKAYMEKNYTLAINKYSILIHNFHSNNERIRMNLANAYFQNKDTAEAIYYYKKLSTSPDAFLRSVSNQQLGIISAMTHQDKKALSFFKEALKADPANEGARFNYELISKKIKEKEKTSGKVLPNDKKDEGKMQEDGSKDEKKGNGDNGEKKESPKNNPQGNSENQDKASVGGEGKQEQGQKNSNKSPGSSGEENSINEELELDEKGNKEREVMISRRLKKINMTEEKARTILDAMKNAETQYLQQIKKPGSGDYGKGKPDW